LQDGYRDKVILMTKNHGRDRSTFEKQLHESLNRLKTDHIDLLQFHEVIHEGVPQRIFGEGAIEAAIDARTAGKIRFIGFTGHRWPHLFHEMLDYDFAWDTVQFPANLLDVQYRSFTQDILPILKSRGIGAIGMKSLVGGRILQAGVSPQEAISYALSLPIDVLVSGIDSMEVLEQNLQIARNWRPLEQEERDALLARVAPWAGDGRLEYYKTN
jgi:predicted aldo/keto reductase-like oxidoreductase